MYKLENPKEAIKINEWLDLQKEQTTLKETSNSLWFWDEIDRAIELKKLKETGCGCPDYQEIGEGQFKASGVDCEDIETVFKLVTDLFKKLHEQFNIKVYSGSCALSGDYFTPEQIKTITKNGTVLSGNKKKKVLDLIKVVA